MLASPRLPFGDAPAPLAVIPAVWVELSLLAVPGGAPSDIAMAVTLVITAPATA